MVVNRSRRCKMPSEEQNGKFVKGTGKGRTSQSDMEHSKRSSR